MLLKDMVLNYIKNIVTILKILISSLSFVDKSLTISIFSFSTAKHKAVS